MEVWLKDGEQLDDLQLNGLKIIQKKNAFLFGIDAVLLANFVSVKSGCTALDLGTGTGIIPILISAKTGAKRIVGLEIQEDMANMAKRSVAMNALNDKIEVLHCDFRDYAKKNLGAFDVVISNPPYFRAKSGMLSQNSPKMIARHEITMNLADLFQSAAELLKPKGRFYLIHRPDRLVDVFCSAREHSLEAKKACLVMSKSDSPPKLILIECVKGAGAELKWIEPIVVYNKDGSYTDQINSIYSRT